MIITQDMWKDFSQILSKEAIGDEFNTAPSGGTSGDDQEMNESDEQFNESTSDDDFMGDLDMGGDSSGFGGDFGGFDSGGGDFSGGGMGGGQGLGTALNPTENPFKGQNGRELLDTKLAELFSSVDNSLKLVQANVKVDKVVIREFTMLLENIKKVREVVFIQPVETSLYRWSLCVKAYQLICKQLCIDNKADQKDQK
jgi:hypothetical protein